MKNWFLVPNSKYVVQFSIYTHFHTLQILSSNLIRGIPLLIGRLIKTDNGMMNMDGVNPLKIVLLKSVKLKRVHVSLFIRKQFIRK